MTLDEIKEIDKEVLAARYEAAVAERSATLSAVRSGVALATPIFCIGLSGWTNELVEASIEFMRVLFNTSGSL